MKWQASYSTLSCAQCERDRNFTVEGKFAGRVPKCERDGPDSCPISAGNMPRLSPEMREVVEVYSMLAHPLVQDTPALQQDILDIFRSNKTMEGYRYFYTMLFTLHDVYSRNNARETDPVVPLPGGGRRALSKGAR